MTLRNRLILSVLALITLVGLTIGVVSSVALNGFLLGRLDSQLQTATNRSLTSIDRHRPESGLTGTGSSGDPAFVGGPGQAAGTLGGFTRSGVVDRAAIVDSAGVVQQLSAEQLDILSALIVTKAPQTVSLGGSLGDYRVAFDRSPSGDGIIVGLPLSDVTATVTQLVIVTVAVTVGGLIVAALLGTVLIRLALRPLDRVEAMATRVTRLRLDRGDVVLAERVPDADADLRTEVGRVGASLNKMLGHLASALASRQASENKMRQFVADASHELRTPLASIRGYAELTRRGDFELPVDVSHSLGRIESEATRMTSLVEDLLLLARLDEGPAIENAPVDLTRLLVDAVSDAHVAAGDHEWVLDLPEEPIEVSGDGPRLYQVVSNLLANARVHTPAGTEVTVSLASKVDASGSSSAIITVSDDGPGIDPLLVDTLFERFVRGDVSRFRQAGSTSTGLGLAIVRAVVDAHGGSVEVASRPGNTEFRIVLPLRGHSPLGEAVLGRGSN
ncbi:two-component system, OmpR family, sensor kinase [Agreia bicolorata]|uniref:histidine kinase n=1 Tax=Agreia bicolorata TaxID=110935 RepID=A0A1T4WZ73_9MICO|nr:HAMP domain-containing sensor histidine kinase [Agreia bicolorata]SKA82662.1 two-component system, OmpR family, sensor kinase [Agreia bicolorata]